LHSQSIPIHIILLGRGRGRATRPVPTTIPGQGPSTGAETTDTGDREIEKDKKKPAEVLEEKFLPKPQRSLQLVR